MRHRCDWRVRARGDDRESRRRRGDEVAMARPDPDLVGYIVEQHRRASGTTRRLAENRDRGVSVLALRRRLDASAQRMRHQLHAVADAEHGFADVVHSRIAGRRASVRDALRATRQDDSRRIPCANLVDRRVGRPDFGVDRQLAQAPSDQLCVLRPEIQNDDGLMGQRRCPGPLAGRCRTARPAACQPCVERYYSGVARRWTTICCSAVALTALCCAPAVAQSPRPRPHPVPPPSEKQLAKAAKTPPALVPTRPVWTLALTNQLSAPPAFDHAHAYFALDGDRLVAYSLPAGKREWMVSARPLLQPTAADDIIVLVEAAGLVARRSVDGSVAWQLALSDPPTVSPAFDNGWLIVTTKSGQIGALRATDGTIVWQRSLGSPANATASLADDRVYVSTSDGRVVALRVDTGEPVWERRLGGAGNEILVSGDRLYVGTKDNFFYCVLTKDGTIDWRWRTGGDVIGQAQADERHVFFVALDNVLRAMDRKSGAQVWMRPLPVRPSAGVVLAGSSLVVTGQAAQLRVFTTKDGTAALGEPIAPGAAAP